MEQCWTSPGGPGGSKNTVKYTVFAAVHVAPPKSSRTSKSAPGRAKTTSKRRPGTARDTPGAVQEASGQRQEPPGAPQEHPQSRLESASERPWQPNKAHLASKSPPEASRRRFLELHGAIFHPPGGDSHTILAGSYYIPNCPVCKTCASIRPESLDVLV